jgi:hypothetical protein
MTIYVSIKKNNSSFVTKILGNENIENIELSYKEDENNNVHTYARLISSVCDFLQTNADVVLFSDDVMTTNMLNSWIKNVDGQTCKLSDLWNNVKQKIENKSLKISAYTTY